MKTSDAKKLIGKRVAWDRTLDRHRATYRTYCGILSEVDRRNVVVNGSYYWLPDLEKFREATEDDLKYGI